jgi:hypothetical protein
MAVHACNPGQSGGGGKRIIPLRYPRQKGSENPVSKQNGKKKRKRA